MLSCFLCLSSSIKFGPWRPGTRFKTFYKSAKNSALSTFLIPGLKCKSALFRHEIAYVLGQMQHRACIPELLEALGKSEENSMVRHECAEALGSIAQEDCLDKLKEFLTDEERVVRESCVVALDMGEHETSSEFQYCDGLSKVGSQTSEPSA